MHHPLAVAMDCQPTRSRPFPKWTCRTPLQGAEDYEYEDRPVAPPPDRGALDDAQIAALACGWLRRRRVEVHCTTVGLADPARRRLWVADLLGERKGRPVLAVTYFTRKRGTHARPSVRAYVAGLREVCRSVYKLRGVQAAVINVYGAGRVEGAFLE